MGSAAASCSSEDSASDWGVDDIAIAAAAGGGVGVNDEACSGGSDEDEAEDEEAEESDKASDEGSDEGLDEAEVEVEIEIEDDNEGEPLARFFSTYR